MQHVKNAIGGNAMKMLKMHQNALKCTRMRMGKINTTFGKKQQQTRLETLARTRTLFLGARTGETPASEVPEWARPAPVASRRIRWESAPPVG